MLGPSLPGLERGCPGRLACLKPTVIALNEVGLQVGPLEAVSGINPPLGPCDCTYVVLGVAPRAFHDAPDTYWRRWYGLLVLPPARHVPACKDVEGGLGRAADVFSELPLHLHRMGRQN